MSMYWRVLRLVRPYLKQILLSVFFMVIYSVLSGVCFLMLIPFLDALFNDAPPDAAQAAVMVAKIIAYESAVNTRTWENELLLIADNQRPGAEYLYEADFEAMNEEAAALIMAARAPWFEEEQES